MSHPLLWLLALLSRWVCWSGPGSTCRIRTSTRASFSSPRKLERKAFRQDCQQVPCFFWFMQKGIQPPTSFIQWGWGLPNSIRPGTAERNPLSEETRDHYRKRIPILRSYGLATAANYLDDWITDQLELAPLLDVSAHLASKMHRTYRKTRAGLLVSNFFFWFVFLKTQDGSPRAPT